MTAINSLSTEPRYSVKVTSELTGIKPVTLRMWERRYDLISPKRDENGYRLYSEQDLAILNWLDTKKRSGVSISTAVANLQYRISNNDWPDVVPYKMIQTSSTNLTASEPYAEKLFELLSNQNEAEAARLFEEAIAKFNLETLLFDILSPCLNSIGEAWSTGDLLISTEHFASAFILSRLYNLFISLPIVVNPDTILVGGAPTEQHSMGPLMMSILLRSKGYSVEFLGGNLDLDDLVDYSENRKPALVILTASMSSAALELLRAKAKLDTLVPAPIFCYAGLAFDLNPNLVEKIPGIYLGKTMEKSVALIRQLMPAK